MNRAKVLLIVLGVFLVLTRLPANEMIELVRGGVPKAAIVLSPSANETEKFAAGEFVSHIRKITGAELPAGTDAPKGMLPVRFAVAGEGNWKQHLTKAGETVAGRIRNDGFVVDASKNAVTLVGGKRRSMYFAAYHLLRKYGGVRWLYPGDEGTYIPKSKDFALPAGAFVKNPDFTAGFPMERGRFDQTTKLWLARNLLPFGTKSFDKVFAMPCVAGGHEMTRLLVGFPGVHFKSEKEFNAACDALFKAHPEYFGLVNGKRVPSGNWMPRGMMVSQPCTSNPEVVRIMAAHIRDKVRTLNGHEIIYRVANDDHLSWCQCENCRAIDGKGKPPIHGVMSNRWWNFANALTKEYYKEAGREDSVKLNFIAYQNFCTPPDNTKLDPRFTIQFCTHGRCYIHPLTDPRCAVNASTRKLFENFAETGNLSDTFEYPEQLPGNHRHLFREKTWIADLKYYHKLGMAGFGTNFYSADTDFSKNKTFSTKADIYNNKRYSDFLFWYLTAYFSWNIDDDPDMVTDEIERIYYGPAYPPMKEYRKYFEYAVLNAGVHMSTKLRSFALIGECAARAGGIKKPAELLRKAVILAKDDPVYSKRMAIEEKIFNEEWKSAYDYYLNMDGKPEHAQRRTGNIVIDGKLDETDWQSARAITDFQLSAGPKDKPGAETRVVFDDENIYFGFKAYKTKAGLDTKKLGSGVEAFRGTHVELFLTPFGASGPYYMLVFTPTNHLFQAKFGPNKSSRDDTVRIDPEWKAVEVPDSWQVEARIPLAPMKAKIIDGAIWKFNVLNQSLNEKGLPQYSSCSGGIAHGSEGHLNMVFGEVVPLIRNGGFETLEDYKPTGKKDSDWDVPGGKIPALWYLARKNTGKIEIVSDSDKKSNHYLRVTGNRSYISQRFIPKKDQKSKVETYRVEGRVRGNGVLQVTILGDRRQNAAPNSEITLKDLNTWQDFSVVIECKANALYLQVTGTVELDDIRVAPCTENANAEIDAF
ncbi:MAG: hypothetical protein BWY31_02757 [Lentisphaerae bacterium ADurb.Bin242]|nr:MAG: hypothetical protein BWY31_02757 [Lentisphaerae bacterium ADurb.Bin242]